MVWVVSTILSLVTRLAAPFILPFLIPVLGILGLSAMAYAVMPHLPGFLLRTTAKLARSAIGGLVHNNILGSLSDTALTKEVALLPLRAIVAAPACALLGTFCHLSILTPRLQGPSDASGGRSSVAQPFWRWSTFHVGTPGVLDEFAVGRLARGLSKEVKQASTIFDSLTNVGEHSLSLGSEYVR